MDNEDLVEQFRNLFGIFEQAAQRLSKQEAAGALEITQALEAALRTQTPDRKKDPVSEMYKIFGNLLDTTPGTTRDKLFLLGDMDRALNAQIKNLTGKFTKELRELFDFPHGFRIEHYGREPITIHLPSTDELDLLDEVLDILLSCGFLVQKARRDEHDKLLLQDFHSESPRLRSCTHVALFPTRLPEDWKERLMTPNQRYDDRSPLQEIQRLVAETNERNMAVEAKKAASSPSGSVGGLSVKGPY